MIHCTILAALIVAAAGLGAAQPTPRRQPSNEQIRRMQEIHLPSGPHDRLARLAGTWEQETEYAGPGGTALRTRGTVVNRSILEGRFIVSESTAQQLEGPFKAESMLVFGFDGRTRQHTVIVLDTFGTYYVTASGATADGSNRTVMSGETREGSRIKRFDVVLEWLDADIYRTEIVFHHPGATAPQVAVASTQRRLRSDRSVQ